MERSASCMPTHCLMINQQHECRTVSEPVAGRKRSQDTPRGAFLYTFLTLSAILIFFEQRPELSPAAAFEHPRTGQKPHHHCAACIRRAPPWCKNVPDRSATKVATEALPWLCAAPNVRSYLFEYRWPDTSNDVLSLRHHQVPHDRLRALIPQYGLTDPHRL